MKEKIKILLQKATEDYLKKGSPDMPLPSIIVEVPRVEKFGEYSSNIAIQLSSSVKAAPKTIADGIVSSLMEIKGSRLTFSRVEVAPQGFINMVMADDILHENLKNVIRRDKNYGNSEKSKKERILLEYVSANPTGPLHVGHGRWAVIGSTLANILKASGIKVDSEFYVNDTGNQVDMLVRSVEARMTGKDVPEGGYGGEYVKVLSSQFRNGQIDQIRLIRIIMDEQKRTLDRLGVKFDRWFSEKSLYSKGSVRTVINKMKGIGVTFDEKGALWFRSTSYGDDKDRVLVREDGIPTYFTSDIAYHVDKFSRRYDRLIDVWGTDHHGYVTRIKAALEALGYPKEKLEVIIGQLVSLFRGKEQVRMSKRTGDIVTISEVMDEIGVDATRYFLVRTSPNTHLDFDLELAKSRSHENPVYYVQYAHARICSILKEAKQKAVKRRNDPDLGLLKDASERRLLVKIMRFPDEVEDAAVFRQPHKLTAYAEEAAAIFHSFYHNCRVVSDDTEMSSARLLLVDGARIVIRNVLKLLGVTAPEHM